MSEQAISLQMQHQARADMRCHVCDGLIPAGQWYDTMEGYPGSVVCSSTCVGEVRADEARRDAESFPDDEYLLKYWEAIDGAGKLYPSTTGMTAHGLLRMADLAAEGGERG